MDAKTMIEDILVEAMIEEIGRSVEIEDRSTGTDRTVNTTEANQGTRTNMSTKGGTGTDRTVNTTEAIQGTRTNMLTTGGTGAERRDEALRGHSPETGALEGAQQTNTIGAATVENHQRETETGAEIVQ